MAWTLAIAALALGLYLFFQLRNPAINFGSAIAATLFFASGIVATVASHPVRCRLWGRLPKGSSPSSKPRTGLSGHGPAVVMGRQQDDDG